MDPVFEVTDEINHMYTDVTSISSDVEKIIQAMQKIETLSSDNRQNIGLVLSESEDQAAAIEEINALMEQLSSMAEQLDKRTHHFKLDNSNL